MRAVAIARQGENDIWEVQYADFPDIVGRAANMFDAVSAASGLLDLYLEGLIGDGGRVPVLRTYEEVLSKRSLTKDFGSMIIEIEMPEY